MKIGTDTTFLVQVCVREHEQHIAAYELLQQRIAEGDVFVLTPQVISEFIHVVTDPRRFEHPLTVALARQKAEEWWNASETFCVFPNEETLSLFWGWMTALNLGRKRLLDTMLAATYGSNGINSIVTSNVRDYTAYGCFQILTPQ